MDKCDPNYDSDSGPDTAPVVNRDDLFHEQIEDVWKTVFSEYINSSDTADLLVRLFSRSFSVHQR